MVPPLGLRKRLAHVGSLAGGAPVVHGPALHRVTARRRGSAAAVIATPVVVAVRAASYCCRACAGTWRSCVVGSHGDAHWAAQSHPLHVTAKQVNRTAQ